MEFAFRISAVNYLGLLGQLSIHFAFIFLIVWCTLSRFVCSDSFSEERHSMVGKN